MKYVLEICIDNLDAALAAYDGGADRLEVCADLSEGGLTPSVDLLKKVKKQTTLPAFVMIRPRGGEFSYTAGEFKQMLISVSELNNEGADGFVFGILKEDGGSSYYTEPVWKVDIARTSMLVMAAQGKPCTFHRAFDRVSDLVSAAHDVSESGCSRILTSGGEEDAVTGVSTLAGLIEKCKGEVTIMPGGGIRETNLSDIIRISGAAEYHSSARKGSGPGPWKVDSNSVRAMRAILEEAARV